MIMSQKPMRVRKRKGVNPQAEEKGNPAPLKAKTDGQRDYLRAMAEYDIVIATGPAGSGKTACAIGKAAQALLQGEIERIIITRPCVEANGKATNNFGALPGELKDKIAPYLIPVYEQLKKFLGLTKFNECIMNKAIEVSPLEFMRGRTFDNAYIILDEAQNCTLEQLKMLITRLGEGSKACINGDAEQTDLRYASDKDYDTDLELLCDKLEGVEGVAIVELNDGDIVRNKLIAGVLRALR